MATLQKKKVKNYAYWYIVESRRINGKPRPVVLKYLGTAENILQHYEAETFPDDLISYSHGGVMALARAADELGIVDLINRFAGPTRRGQSVGQSLLWIAINRALAPTSKRNWTEWAQGTSLEKIYATRLPAASASFFWDQMDAVSDQALDAIRTELCQRLLATADSDLDTLFYDTTNFYTYIDTNNLRNTLTRRGRNKQKRHDLRQYGLLMMVEERRRLPISWEVYEGHRNDVDVFGQYLPRLAKSVRSLRPDGPISHTLVYDGGNLSRANQKKLERLGFSYVARFPLGWFPPAMALDDRALTPLEGHAGYRVWRQRARLWGRERTVVVIHSPRLHRKQWANLLRQLGRCLVKLRECAAELAAARSRRTRRAQEKKLEACLKGAYLNRLITWQLTEDKPGFFRLAYRVDHGAMERLKSHVLGRRVIVTDRDDWSTERIVAAYHGQSKIERVFRDLKDRSFISVQPNHHWTDHKIKVHLFTCVLAYLLSRTVYENALQAGYEGSMPRLMNDLNSIRLVCRMEKRTRPGRPRLRWQLEKVDPQRLKIYRSLVPESSEPIERIPG